MNRNLNVFMGLLLILSFTFAVKQLLPFQARIVDVNGNIVSSGDVNIQIYDRDAGGTLIYSETATINDGYVETTLGLSTDLDLIQGKHYWLDLDINTGSGYEDLNFGSNDRLEFESTRGNMLMVDEQPSDDLIIRIPDDNAFKVQTSSNTLVNINGNSANFWNNGFHVMDENGQSLIYFTVSNIDQNTTSQSYDINFGNYASVGLNYQNIFTDSNIQDNNLSTKNMFVDSYVFYDVGDYNDGSGLFPIHLFGASWDLNSTSGQQNTSFSAAPFYLSGNYPMYAVQYNYDGSTPITRFTISDANTGRPILDTFYDGSTPITRFTISDANTGPILDTLHNGFTTEFTISDPNTLGPILDTFYDGFTTGFTIFDPNTLGPILDTFYDGSTPRTQFTISDANTNNKMLYLDYNSDTNSNAFQVYTANRRAFSLDTNFNSTLPAIPNSLSLYRYDGNIFFNTYYFDANNVATLNLSDGTTSFLTLDGNNTFARILSQNDLNIQSTGSLNLGSQSGNIDISADNLSLYGDSISVGSSKGQLNVSCASTFTSAVTMSNALDANSTDLNYLDVNNTANFDSDVTIGGDLNVSTNLIFNAAMYVEVSAIQTANYTASATDYIILTNTTGGAFTVTLPDCNSATIGRVLVIVDAGGVSDVNNVTIAAASGDSVDGDNNILLDANYGSQRIVCGTVDNWYTW